MPGGRYFFGCYSTVSAIVPLRARLRRIGFANDGLEIIGHIGVNVYSARSATTGSTFVARRAGIRTAANPAAARTAMAMR